MILSIEVKTRTTIGLVLSLFLLPLIESAPAQASELGAAEVEAAWEQMARLPGDPDAALAYARIAASTGEARTAIGGLELALRLHPDRDDLRYQLASLHAEDGACEQARSYVQAALESPSIPDDAAERSRQLLRRIDRACSRQSLNVSIYAGFRYDTNANEATTLGTVPVFVPMFQDFVQVPAQNRGKADWSMVFGATAQHRVDLGLQREGAWESNASIFDQRFARIPREYDLSVASIDSGPRIGVYSTDSGSFQASLRPFATAGWLAYASSTYAWLYGGGLSAEFRMPPRWRAEVAWIGRYGNYQNSGFRPTARQYTGLESTIAASVTYDVARDLRLVAGISYFQAGARVEYYERQGYGLNVAAETTVPVGDFQIAAQFRGYARHVSFDAPDPYVDPTKSRKDDRWGVGAAFVLPLTECAAAVAEYDYFRQNSNYGFYEYDNHAVSLGVRFSF